MKRVRVRVPGDATTLISASGDQVNVLVDDEGRYRFADMLEEDVQKILFSGLAESLPWRELNPSLINTLGRPSPTHPGYRISDLQQQAIDSQPLNPFDKASIVRQALGMGRVR